MKKIFYILSVLFIPIYGISQSLSITGDAFYFSGVYNYCAGPNEVNFIPSLTINDPSSYDPNLLTWELQYTDGNGTSQTATNNGFSLNTPIPIPQSTSFVNLWYKKGTSEADSILNLIYIFAEEKPIIDMPDIVPVCNGEVLEVTPLISNKNPYALNKYQWTDKDGIVLSNTDGMFTAPDTSVYYFHAWYTFPKNCETRDSVMFKNITPIADIGDDISVCLDEEVTITNAWIPGPNYIATLEYEWTGISSMSNSYTTTSSGIVTLQVMATEADSTCYSIITDQIEIVHLSNPIVELGNDTTVIDGPVMIQNTINNGTTADNYSYSWKDESSTEVSFSETFSLILSGKYSIEVTNDLTNCITTDTITVIIEQAPVREAVPEGGIIFVATAFSPEGNVDENRSLRVNGENISDVNFYFTIRDRWGGIVFETDSPSLAQSGWNGENSISGVYTFTVQGQYLDGTLISEAGTSTLVK